MMAEIRIPNQLKIKAGGLVSRGIRSVEIVGKNLIFELTDGSTVNVGEVVGNNGKNIEFIWNGTNLGVRIEGETEYQYTNLQGSAATITAGTVTTGAAGTNASVTNRGTSTAAIFDFAIPRGNKGDKGDTGDTGEQGEAATIEVGTVTTGAAGTNASVTNRGTSTAAIFDFAIPRGNKGDKGDTGKGLDILGTYPTVAALETAVTDPTQGDMYNVGTAAPYNIYMWDDGQSAWIDQGQLQGPQGDAGTITIGTVTTGAAGTPASVVNRGTSENAILDFTIPQGLQGDVSGAIAAHNADTTAHAPIRADISDIQSLIPSAATTLNELADKAFVNSTVGTNTAIFRGTFDSVAALEAYSGAKTNNDYAFVVIYDTTIPTQVVEYDRYKYNGNAWAFEYSLNNSSFTAMQWAAIQSGITASQVSIYDDHVDDDDIHVTAAQKIAWNAKADAEDIPQAGTDYVAPAMLGAANGAATLDGNAKLTADQAAAGIVTISQNTTIGLEHSGKFLKVSGAYTITLPTNASVAVPIGAEIEICQYGSGTVTITGATGVTLNGISGGSAETAEQYACIALKKIGTNEWIAAGGLK